MFKIDNATAATVMPTPGSPGPNVDGFFKNGTDVTADWLNAVQEEICYVITQAGGTLDKTDRTQLYNAIHQMMTEFGGITQVSDDLSPSLGGDLDVNGFAITASSGNVELEAPSGVIDLNAPSVLVHTDIQHRGDTNNKITFGTDTQNFQVNGASVFDLSASGLRLGAANARVTTIDDDVTMAANSATRLVTQHAAKGYADSIAAKKFFNFVGGFNGGYNSSVSIPPNSTAYVSLGWPFTGFVPGAAASTYAYCFVMPYAMTLSKLNIYGNYSGASSNTYVFTLYINGSATSLTVSLSGGVFSGFDLTHSVSVNAGDAIALQVVIDNVTPPYGLSALSWSVQGIV